MPKIAPLGVDAFGENPHHQGRENRGCCETEGQGNHLSGEARRIEAKVSGNRNGHGHGRYGHRAVPVFR